MKASAAAAVLAALAATPSLAQPGPAASLCRPSEAVLFACRLRAKTVSICGQGEQGGAVYRYGRPGHVEIEATDLHRALEPQSGGGETQVYADTPTHRYIVYDQVVRTGFGPDGHFDPKETAGVAVQSGGRTVLRLECTQWIGLGFDRLAETLVPEGAYVPH